MISASNPRVKLSKLREIGWESWDPIGIRDMVNGDYSEGPADEYDSYLMAAYGMLSRGKSETEVASYLNDIASNHMGLGPANDDGASCHETAHRLAELLKALT